MLAKIFSLKAGASLLALASSLGAVLAGPVVGRQTTEGEVVTAAVVTTTVTGYAHPLTRTPLTTLGADQSPLSYASPPTAITVPTRHHTLVNGAVQTRGVEVKAETPSATTAVDVPGATAVCTTIAGNYPTATIPNFCNPSAMVNAPGFLPARSNLPTATVTIGAVSNKLDCCVQCADVFNCVAWRFVPVYTQTPNAHLPGGFDPWGRGDCEAVYHIGNPKDEVATGIISVVDDQQTANLCPNGNVGEVLAGSDGDGVTNGTDSWMNLYYDGWNEGPCANPAAPFEAGQDSGKGDADKLCA